MIRPQRTRPEVQDDEDVNAGGPEGLNAEDVAAAQEEIEGLRFGRRRHAHADMVRRPPLVNYRASSEAYAGEPPPVAYVVEGRYQRGIAGLIVGGPGTGKTDMGMRFGQSVAAGPEGGRCMSHFLGGEIVAHGPSVLLTSQDSQAAMHRRLHRAGLSRPENLIIYPVLNTGGPMSLFRKTMSGDLEVTEQYLWLRSQLLELRPAVIIFDPLQTFCNAIDITKIPEHGEFVGATFNTLATETSSLVLAFHHLKKGVFNTRETAREAARGVSTLIDSFRAVFIIWRPDLPRARTLANQLGIPEEPDDEHLRGIFEGAMDKINDEPEGPVRVFVRRRDGWGLIDRTEDLARARSCNRLQTTGNPALNAAIIRVVRERAAAGEHLTRTGVGGLDRNLDLLGMTPLPGRDVVRAAVTELLNQPRLRRTPIIRYGKTVDGLVAADEPPGTAAMAGHAAGNVVQMARPEVRTRTPRGGAS